METQVIPVFRIFDYQKAIDCYVNWLGFEVVWEHTFNEDSPIYLEIKRGDIRIHLSEHFGDGTPGTHVFIWTEQVAEYHTDLIQKNYKFNRPGLHKTFYDAVSFTAYDPFGNRIIFNEHFVEAKHGNLKFEEDKYE